MKEKLSCMKIIRIGAVVMILLFVVKCFLSHSYEDTLGVFISTKNKNDILIMFNDGRYTRIIFKKDTSIIYDGKWNFLGNNVCFEDWLACGVWETEGGILSEDIIKIGTKHTFCTSFDSNIFNFYSNIFKGLDGYTLEDIEEIYMETDDYYYYKRMK